MMLESCLTVDIWRDWKRQQVVIAVFGVRYYSIHHHAGRDLSLRVTGYVLCTCTMR